MSRLSPRALVLLGVATSFGIFSAAHAAPANSVASSANPFTAENDVTWTTLGVNEYDSMPIGNGDFSANVWTEPNGDLVLLLAKADAWTETGALVKLGRVRLRFSPTVLSATPDFSQALRLATSTLEIKSGGNTVRVWVDANQPVVHVEGRWAQPTTVEASAEFWRKTVPATEAPSSTPDARVAAGDAQPRTAPDVIFRATAGRVAWAHFNSDSYYPYLLRQEHLEACLGKYTDPLLHRCFGAALTGSGLVSADDHTLKSSAPATTARLDFVAYSEKSCASPQAWLTALDQRIAKAAGADLAIARGAHERWWQQFWDRSWVHVTGDEAAADVSQGYAVQRYLLACASRGEIPPKFNGGPFTVGRDLPPGSKNSNAEHNPDYRAWGDSYWNQNNRLLYWPLIATGDLDLLQPWFDMYFHALPLATDRTRIYYQHAGAHFPETMHFWGLPNLHDFGKDNATNEIQSRWQRYHVQGSLEVIAQMLDVFDQTQEAAFARERLVPFADAIVTFYAQHYPREVDGTLRFDPAQSLETYQVTAINPTPDIAGLRSVLPRLIALPAMAITNAQRDAWRKTLAQLPPIPIGRTAKGKLPPLGQSDADGRPTILPAARYDKPGNSENPELYVTFPYRLYGVGKPDLALARDTFAARRSPQSTCWGQDGNQAAVLGLTSTAQQAVTAAFTNFGDQHFRYFWKPAHDWIPDLDNGGDGMIALQLMLLQCDGRRMILLPAWPKNWTADFRLHAPYQTTITAHVEAGKLTRLQVNPESRRADVQVWTEN